MNSSPRAPWSGRRAWRPRRWRKSLGVPLDRAGRVQVQADLSVPGYPEIFVAGDLASVQQDGKPVPGVAPAAKQMGRHVAHAIRARLDNRPAPAFHYKDYGNLATIGRMAAIVHFGKLKLSGLLAWWFWLAAHVFFLIGFRNRLVVLLNWAWAYWSYQRGARIILGSERRSGAVDTAGVATGFRVVDVQIGRARDRQQLLDALLDFRARQHVRRHHHAVLIISAQR